MKFDRPALIRHGLPPLVYLLVAVVILAPGSVLLWAYELDGAFYLGELSNAFVLKQGLIEQHRVVSGTDVLGYPQYGVLVFISWANLLLILLGDMLGSAVAGLNFSMVLTLGLAGWMAFLLAERLGGSRAAAWVAGVFFAFNPFILGVIFNAQVSYANHAWVALYALLLVDFFERGGWGRLVAIAVTAAWVLLTSPYFGVMCWMLTPLVPAWWLLRRPDQWRTILLRTALVFAAGVAGDLGPYFYLSMLDGVPESELLLPAPYCPAERLIAHAGNPQPGNIGSGADTGMACAGLFAIFLPLGAGPENMLLHLDYLGASIFLLLGGAGVARWRLGRGERPDGPMSSVLPWLATAVVFGVLALGPYLVLTETFVMRSGGGWYPLPFLWAWQYLPFFSRVCTPYRFLLMTCLCLVPVMALLLGPLLERLAGRVRAGVVAALALVLLLDFTVVSQVPWPLPWKRVEVPRVVYDLEADPDPGAVLEIPYQEPKGLQFWYDDHIQPTPPFWNERIAFHQTVHGKRLGVRMTVIALPPAYEHSHLVRSITDVVAGRQDLPGSTAEPGCEAVPVDPWLQEHGFRYLVVHEHLLHGERVACVLQRLEASLVLQARYPDEGVSLWRFEAPIGGAAPAASPAAAPPAGER